jgi:hypothetical protein
MIKLKHLLRELEESDVNRLLDKIKEKQFRFFAQGDNGRVYEIDGEDKLFKISKSADELDVAEVIVGRSQEFTTFIPIYYFKDNMFIMAKANPLSSNLKHDINKFMDRFKDFSRSEGGEVSIFDFLDTDVSSHTDIKLINFLRALQQDVNKIGIDELDLDLDFRVENVMMWNGNLVMVDW